MSTFPLEIMTPERLFFRGDVESVTIQCLDGELCVLKHHAPMFAALAIGEMKLSIDGHDKFAVNSEGFMEVTPDKVVIFVQACEWPEEIDIARAEEAKQRNEEKLRQQQSVIEHRQTEIAITRAMMRLRTSSHKYNQ